MPNKKDKDIQSVSEEEQFILPDKADFAIDYADSVTELNESEEVKAESEDSKETSDAMKLEEETEENIPYTESPDVSAEIITKSEATEEAIEEAEAEMPSESSETVTDNDDEGETIEDTKTEVFPTETKSGLLNVEHFSDYKSRSKLLLEEAEEATELTEKTTNEDSYSESTATEVTDSEDEEEAEAFSAPTYESMTLLDEDEGVTDTEKAEEVSNKKYDDPDREAYNPEKPRKIDARFDFLELFILTLVAVMIITTFIFRHSVVEGPSMLNTLEEGDHLIISDTFYTPERGDIVVCQDHATGHTNPIVKRIIAIEGDSIEILPNGMVFVNDKLLIEDYVYLDGPDHFQGMAKTTVPEDMVFVMGDHRNLSSDSRTFESTFVREDAILGKVILRFYPFSKFGTVE